MKNNTEHQELIDTLIANKESIIENKSKHFREIHEWYLENLIWYVKEHGLDIDLKELSDQCITDEEGESLYDLHAEELAKRFLNRLNNLRTFLEIVKEKTNLKFNY